MPKATAVFDADDSRFGAALTRINGRMLALQSRIAKFAVGLRGNPRSGPYRRRWFRSTSRCVRSGRLAKRSCRQIPDVAVGDLLVLQQEFANAGKSAEDVGPVLGKMAKSLHSNSTAENVAKLGLNLEELKRMTPAEQVRALGNAINSVTDSSERAAVSTEIFGRSGAELLSLFSSDGFGDASQQLGSTGGDRLGCRVVDRIASSRRRRSGGTSYMRRRTESQSKLQFAVRVVLASGRSARSDAF